MPKTTVTELRERGADLGRLKSDKMRRFVLEHLIDHSKKAAAIRAGYPEKSAGAMATKLLKNPIIKAYLGKIEREDVERLDLDREEVLRQLWYALTRKVTDFVDKNGEIKNPNKMSERAQNVIDGLEQEVFIDAETGNRRIKTKLRLSSKVSAIDMAMKHKGLFAPVEGKMLHQLDWDSLLTKGKIVDAESCPVERRLLEEEGK